jgi:hypothetical protein
MKVITGKFDSLHQTDSKYKESNQQNQGGGTSAEDLQNYQVDVYRSQIVADSDPLFERGMKIIHRLNVLLMPLLVTSVLNILVGTSFAFCFVLYFIVLLAMIPFNLLELHKKLTTNKIALCICENLWIIATFFWLVNIWSTGKHQSLYGWYWNGYYL